MADHLIPPKDVSCADQSRRVRVFWREMGLSNFLKGGRVSEGGFQVLTETMVLEITDEGVEVADEDDKRRTLGADTVVLAVGLKSDNKLPEMLGDTGAEVYPIGDCTEARKVINAICEDTVSLP
jgi:hypothetical protein